MIYTVSKRMEISASHKLDLDYESPCQNLHGHNWIITVHCIGNSLNKNGMVIDFKKIKELIHDKLDHKYINDVIECNPTAENIGTWIIEEVNSHLHSIYENRYWKFQTYHDEIEPICYKVEVQESEGNTATIYSDSPEFSKFIFKNVVSI